MFNNQRVIPIIPMSCKFFQQVQRMRPDASRFAGANGCAEGDAVLLHVTPELMMS